MTVPDMEKVLELLEQLGLPQNVHEYDVQAVRRFKAASDKHQAAIDAAPAHTVPAAELAAEVEATQKKFMALREERISTWPCGCGSRSWTVESRQRLGVRHERATHRVRGRDHS